MTQTQFNDHLKRALREGWEQQLLEWCLENGIEDVTPYIEDGADWSLGWSYGSDNADPLLRIINLRKIDDDNFAAYSGAFRNPSLGVPLERYGEIQLFSSAASMLGAMPQLKADADKLELTDLLTTEQLKPQFVETAKGTPYEADSMEHLGKPL